MEKLSRRDCDISMDKSHFLWLLRLTYFLKFASQLEIGLDQIGSIISFRIASYITNQDVELLETLEVANRERSAIFEGCTSWSPPPLESSYRRSSSTARRRA